MTQHNQLFDKRWPRIIALADMDAFFAAVEQLDNPDWRNKPVVVTNGELGSCIITCSYEARSFGIHTGMRVREAKKLCPNLIRAPSRPKRYAQISQKFMTALQTITPDIEIFSVDEAFLDISKCRQLYKTPLEVTQKIKAVIYNTTHLPCSIGLSGDKTTAKFAAQLKKPNGLIIIPPWRAENTLADHLVTELCGINKGIAAFLAQYGVVYCKDIKKIPISVLSKRFGNLGRRLWYMCQGKDPEPVHTTINPPKSMGHGKVLPPRTDDPKTILMYFMHMSEKLAARLRHHQMYASKFFIGMKSENWGWLGTKFRSITQTQDGAVIFKLCKTLVKDNPNCGVVRQIQVTALNPIAEHKQLDLFFQQEHSRTVLQKTIDAINDKYGEFTISPAMMLKHTTMPNVISPAWRPNGHRDNI